MRGTWESEGGGGGLGYAVAMIAAIMVIGAILMPLIITVVHLAELVLVVAAVIAGLILVASAGLMAWRFHHRPPGERLPLFIARRLGIGPAATDRPELPRYMRPSVPVYMRPELPGQSRSEVAAPIRAPVGQTADGGVHNHTHLHLSELSPDAAEAIGRALRGGSPH